MKKFMHEFKAFALKGNVFDMAVGIIIGTAFGAIVNSLVKDLIMPLFGIILGGIDFTAMSFAVGDSVITYGNLIQNIVNFAIISFTMFVLIKIIGKVRRRNQEAEEEKKEEEPKKSDEAVLLEQILEQLKDGKDKSSVEQ